VTQGPFYILGYYILGIGDIPAWIIHRLAIVTDAEFEVTWVVVLVAAVVTGANVIAAIVASGTCAPQSQLQTRNSKTT